MNLKQRLSAFGIAVLTAVATSTIAAPTYKLEFAPPLNAPGPFYQFSTNEVNGINASGTVAITEQADGVDGGSDTLAGVWDTAGNHIGLTEPFVGTIVADVSRAVAINQSGQILVTEAGSVYLITNGVRSIVQIGLLQPYPTSMNDSGTIVGRYSVTINGTTQNRAFIFANGLATDLGTLPGAINSSARNVNNLGHVVGGALISATAGRAVLWRNGAIIDLGTLPGDTSSTAIAINDNGQIIGTSTGANGTRGFIWQNGVMSDLGPFGTNKFIEPRDIDNAGNIVGVARLSATSTIYDYGYAFAWSSGVYKNLNPLFGQLGLSGCSAYAVSDAGHIAGQCGNAYRITPIADAVDVSMDMSTTPTVHARQNDPLVYTMRVTNTGSLPASGVAVVDTLPTSVTFVSATTTQGSCSGVATVTCTIGELAPGTDATVSITVIPTQKMVAPMLANSATVTLNETDVNPITNSSTVFIDVQAPIVYADLGVTMVASPSKVRRGQLANYTMTVSNNGPQSAQAVSLVNKIPPNFYAIKSTQGTCGGPDIYNPSTISCSLGTLAKGATATVTLTIRPQTTGTYTNRATVSAFATDNNATNNTASASVTVVR